jgi:hypothetical protein
MRSLQLNSRKIETIFYVLIWALVFSVPYFIERDSKHINWEMVKNNWNHLFGYLLIFLINVYVLVPNLLLKKRYLYYVAGVAILILMVVTFSIIFQPGAPPQGVAEGFRPDFRPDQPLPEQKAPFMAFVDNLIISILILGSGTTTKLFSRWMSEEKLRKDIEKEQLKTSLALLKHQVSPHFFMNTLNNIHSLIEMDTAKAQDAVERLSTLMRYLLYDSAQNTIELKKEIEFIYSFISLMQIRHSDEVEVKTDIPDKIPEIKIPPMLFISLLENAFKHGVCYPLKSYIHFELRFDNTSLSCVIKNSKHKSISNQLEEFSGIGLMNIKKSLNLLYDQDYKLDISDKENEFEVSLTIPV